MSGIWAESSMTQSSIDDLVPNALPCNFSKGPNPLLVHENELAGERSITGPFDVVYAFD